MTRSSSGPQSGGTKANAAPEFSTPPVDATSGVVSVHQSDAPQSPRDAPLKQSPGASHTVSSASRGAQAGYTSRRSRAAPYAHRSGSCAVTAAAANGIPTATNNENACRPSGKPSSLNQRSPSDDDCPRPLMVSPSGSKIRALARSCDAAGESAGKHSDGAVDLARAAGFASNQHQPAGANGAHGGRRRASIEWGKDGLVNPHESFGDAKAGGPRGSHHFDPRCEPSDQTIHRPGSRRGMRPCKNSGESRRGGATHQNHVNYIHASFPVTSPSAQKEVGDGNINRISGSITVGSGKNEANGEKSPLKRYTIEELQRVGMKPAAKRKPGSLHPSIDRSTVSLHRGGQRLYSVAQSVEGPTSASMNSTRTSYKYPPSGRSRIDSLDAQRDDQNPSTAKCSPTTEAHVAQQQDDLSSSLRAGTSQSSSALKSTYHSNLTTDGGRQFSNEAGCTSPGDSKRLITAGRSKDTKSTASDNSSQTKDLDQKASRWSQRLQLPCYRTSQQLSSSRLEGQMAIDKSAVTSSSKNQEGGSRATAVKQALRSASDTLDDPAISLAIEGDKNTESFGLNSLDDHVSIFGDMRNHPVAGGREAYNDSNVRMGLNGVSDHFNNDNWNVDAHNDETFCSTFEADALGSNNAVGSDIFTLGDIRDAERLIEAKKLSRDEYVNYVMASTTPHTDSVMEEQNAASNETEVAGTHLCGTQGKGERTLPAADRKASLWDEISGNKSNFFDEENRASDSAGGSSRFLNMFEREKNAHYDQNGFHAEKTSGEASSINKQEPSGAPVQSVMTASAKPFAPMAHQLAAAFTPEAREFLRRQQELLANQRPQDRTFGALSEGAVNSGGLIPGPRNIADAYTQNPLRNAARGTGRGVDCAGFFSGTVDGQLVKTIGVAANSPTGGPPAAAAVLPQNFTSINEVRALRGAAPNQSDLQRLQLLGADVRPQQGAIRARVAAALASQNKPPSFGVMPAEEIRRQYVLQMLSKGNTAAYNEALPSNLPRNPLVPNFWFPGTSAGGGGGPNRSLSDLSHLPQSVQQALGAVRGQSAEALAASLSRIRAYAQRGVNSNQGGVGCTPPVADSMDAMRQSTAWPSGPAQGTVPHPSKMPSNPSAGQNVDHSTVLKQLLRGLQQNEHRLTPEQKSIIPKILENPHLISKQLVAALQQQQQMKAAAAVAGSGSCFFGPQAQVATSGRERTPSYPSFVQQAQPNAFSTVTRDNNLNYHSPADSVSIGIPPRTVRQYSSQPTPVAAAQQSLADLLGQLHDARAAGGGSSSDHTETNAGVDANAMQRFLRRQNGGQPLTLQQAQSLMCQLVQMRQQQHLANALQAKLGKAQSTRPAASNTDGPTALLAQSGESHMGHTVRHADTAESAHNSLASLINLRQQRSTTAPTQVQNPSPLPGNGGQLRPSGSAATGCPSAVQHQSTLLYDLLGCGGLEFGSDPNTEGLNTPPASSCMENTETNSHVTPSGGTIAQTTPVNQGAFISVKLGLPPSSAPTATNASHGTPHAETTAVLNSFGYPAVCDNSSTRQNLPAQLTASSVPEDILPVDDSQANVLNSENAD